MLNISYLGSILIEAALASAFLQALLPAIGYFRKNTYLFSFARPLALLQGFFVSNAFLLLIAAFLSNDFSLVYVAKNSHPSLPFFYRLTAVWGAHEGSFLLWIFLLACWTSALCFFKPLRNPSLAALSLAWLGLISFCFLLFLYFTSNPFLSASNVLPQDLNPLLQDPGFFIHPPMLYAGYVGFSVVFAISLAYLVKGDAKLSEWAAVVRPWVIAAWSFLTLGITLGSWWAYHVLGWGGFWFWDPVENASLLPWLSGIALLHVLVVAEKKQDFLGWAFFLAILSFSLSILGTFLVRSGILISVHSFAHDPSRGAILLLLLGLITGSALALYLFRCLQGRFSLVSAFFWSSREGLLLIQSILLFIAMSTVLLGTLYPLIMEASGLGTLSVGPPYFNQVLFPLLLICLILMGFAPFSEWGKTTWNKAFFYASGRQLLFSLIVGLGLTLFFTQHWNSALILNLSLIFWVVLSVNKIIFKKTNMALAHLGFAVVILSIILASGFSKELEVSLSPGETVKLGPYLFQFVDLKGHEGPNFKGVRARFEVFRQGKKVTTLYPEKRIYLVRQMVMTQVDIYPGIFHDLYLALGEPLNDQAWSLRLYYKPFIRWLWLGGLAIALSGFFSLLRLIGKNHE